MKTLLVALSMAIASAALVTAPLDAEAKRLGGGKPAGMQRQVTPNSATNSATPATPAAAPGTHAAAPAAAPAPAAPVTPPKRNWMGPLAGLAAGLGIAALFSHFGMGAGLSNFVMIALLAVGGFMLFRWAMARFGANNQNAGPQLAGAGAGAGAPFGGQPAQRIDPNMQRDAFSPAPVTPVTPAASSAVPAAALAAGAGAAAAAISLPGGMPTAEFERVAKQVFIRLQAANDAGLVDDLRRFTTPELFASLKADLLERGSATQKTDVVQLDAKVVEAVQEKDQHIVSVRFQGLIREAADAGAEPFDEMWHLVKPISGQGDWMIAGITPTV